jgi:hypothetical protein
VRPVDLIRSGWWVAVAAVACSVLVAIWVLRLPGQATTGDPQPFLLEPCLVDRTELIRAMAPDALRALTGPGVMTPSEVERANEAERGKVLVPSDSVVGVAFGGETRAYPLRLLRWHESVNDTVGDQPIAVTYSPLSGSVAVWNRVVNGRTVELAVSGRLLDSTTLLYDRGAPDGASGLWHQLTGAAITGPDIGLRLTPLPAVLATWEDWRDRHPDTAVMAPDPGSKQLYKRDPYHSYRGSDVLRFPVAPRPPTGGLALKARVAVVSAGEVDTAFPLAYLADAVGAERGTWATAVAGDIYLVHFDAVAGTVRVEPRDPDIAPPALRVTSWFAWYAAHPETVPLP